MDSIILTAPGGGSSIQIGSWLDLPNGGADYGTKGLIQTQFVDNPYGEGALAFENVGPRHMSFPLLINPAAVASLTQLESVLRDFARPGGYIDVAVEGVPTTEAVRFDLLTGRWEPAYDTYYQRVNRRRGTLYLDTSPYGYWPTWIVLASAAPTAGSFLYPITNLWTSGSIIGDAPPLIEMWANPSSVTTPSYMPDVLILSVHNKGPSFNPVFWAASWIPIQTATNITTASIVNNSVFISEAYGGAYAEMYSYFATTASGMFAQLFSWPIPTAVSTAYTGRFHAYAAVAGASQSQGQFLLDVAQAQGSSLTATWAPMASAQQIATMGLFLDTSLSPPLSHFTMVDLGEIAIPGATTMSLSLPVLRLWGKGTGSWCFGGMTLQPVDGEAGILQRGLAQPTIGASGITAPYAFNTAFVAGGPFGGVFGLRGTQPVVDLRRSYIGRSRPQMGLDANSITIDSFTRRKDSQPTMGPFPMHDGYSTLYGSSLRYQPRFQFLKGI